MHYTLLFTGYTPLVVSLPFSSEQKLEFGIVPLFVHGHLLKLGTIPGHKIGQFVDNVL